MNKNLIHLLNLKKIKMVIEILVNNDIQFFFCSNDFKLSKGNKCNYVHY